MLKKENILVIAIICLVIGGFITYNRLQTGKPASRISNNGSGEQTKDSRIDWKEYTKGVALAESKGKPIFLYFHAQWCTYCKKLKTTTFRDKKVLAYLKENFISISVDTDQNRELTNHWKVTGLPTLWFLKPDSSKIEVIPGYVDKKLLLQVLKFINTESYDKMNFNAFVKTL